MIQVHVRVSTVLIVKTSNMIFYVLKSSVHFFQDQQSVLGGNLKCQKRDKKMEENQDTSTEISPGRTIYFIFFMLIS